MKMTSTVETLEQNTFNQTSLPSIDFPEHTQTETQFADVLYQKLGDRWYAFSVIGDEVFVGKVCPKK